MNTPLHIECPELDNFLDTECVPQTHVDLAELEYRKAKLGPDWVGQIECYFVGLIHYTLERSRN